MTRPPPSAAPVDPGFATVIDHLGAVFTGPPWTGEVERARREFDAARGQVRDDEEGFEGYIASFLEWYLLERPLEGSDPPVLRALRPADLALEERAALLALARSHHSLFEVVDVLPRELLLTDSILDGLWRVDPDPPPEGIDPGDIFEARLIPWQNRVLFGAVFCFHPRAVREQIHQLLRRAETAGTLDLEIVSVLAEMKLRHGRFPNLAVERIYTSPEK